jgi:hypothetical protein
MAMTPPALLGGWYPDDDSETNPWDGIDDVTGIPSFVLSFPTGYGVHTEGPYFNVSNYTKWHYLAGDAGAYDYMFAASDIGLDDNFELRYKTVSGGTTFSAGEPMIGIMIWASGDAGYCVYAERESGGLFAFRFGFFDGSSFSEVTTLETGLSWSFIAFPSERYVDMGVRVHNGVCYPWYTSGYDDLQPERNGRVEYAGITPATDLRLLGRTSHGPFAYTKHYNGAPLGSVFEVWDEPLWRATGLVAQDEFTGEDGDNLADHTADLGFGTWQIDDDSATEFQFNHLDLLAAGAPAKAVCSNDLVYQGFRASMDVYGRDSLGSVGAEMGGFSWYVDEDDDTGYALVIRGEASYWGVHFGLWDGVAFVPEFNLTERRHVGLVPWAEEANGVRIGVEVTGRWARCFYEAIGGGTRHFISEPLYMATDRTSFARFGMVLGGGHQYDNYEIREIEDDVPEDDTEPPYGDGPIFPFEPDWQAPVIEGWDFLTDVIEFDDQREQRRRVREVPRRTVAYQVTTLTHRETTQLIDFFETKLGRDWRIPYWPDARWVTGGLLFDVAPYFELQYPWNDHDDNIDRPVIVWHDPFTWYVTELSSVGHGLIESVSVVDPMPFGFVKPIWIAPLRVAWPDVRQSWDRPARELARGIVQFTVF